MERKALSVAIIGGGIGGLSAALSLLLAGLDAHVYEQARSISEVGAGIQVSPNATRILHRFGLSADLERLGVRPLEWHQRRWDDGRTLLRTPLGREIEAEFGSPHYQMHRADLVKTLAGALPSERVHIGQRCVSLVDDGEAVDVEFENGSHARADLVIGADGIHSAVRSVLFGPEEPRFTGCIAYRGLIPAERLAHLNMDVNVQLWMGPHQHFIHYYVQGRQLINFVAVMEQDSWMQESWTEPGDVADVLTVFKDWHPQVRGILEAVDQTFKWALFDRPPMAQWSVGRVTLLGDACHSMLPFLAQGAAQAIEDGATLGVLLSGIDKAQIPATLQKYEAVRKPRVTRVQSGAEQNRRRLHMPDGPEQEARDAEMATGKTDFSFSAVDWLYRYDAG